MMNKLMGSFLVYYESGRARLKKNSQFFTRLYRPPWGGSDDSKSIGDSKNENNTVETLRDKIKRDTLNQRRLQYQQATKTAVLS